MSKVCIPVLCYMSLDLVVSITFIPPSLTRTFLSHAFALFICVQEFIGDEKEHVKGIRTVEINWVQVRILFPWYNSVGI